MTCQTYQDSIFFFFWGGGGGGGGFLLQILKYRLSLESGSLQLEQTKFPVFWQNFQIPCVFPDREFFWPFSPFSLCSGYPVYTLNTEIVANILTHPRHLYYRYFKAYLYMLSLYTFTIVGRLLEGGAQYAPDGRALTPCQYRCNVST